MGPSIRLLHQSNHAKHIFEQYSYRKPHRDSAGFDNGEKELLPE